MVRQRVGPGFLLATLFLAAPAAAQTGAGVKAGISFGNISNKGLLPGNLDTRTGGAAGVYLNIGGGLVGLGIDGL